jgi:hypothetical protein
LKTSTEKELPPCKWKEYPTPDGKVYYSDGINSVWTEPAELTEYKAKLAAQGSSSTSSSNGNSASSASSSSTTSTNGNGGEHQTSKSSSRKRAHVEAIVPAEYESDAQRTEYFVNMLRDYEIGSNHRWPDVSRICSSDARWVALKTTGSRKQCFSEYQTKRLKEEKEEKRNKVRKARDSFLKMLATDTKIGVSWRWKEAEQRLASKEEYQAIETSVLDLREREEMFSEFVSELARKDDEEKRAIRKANIRGFNELLDQYESHITHNSRWLDFRPILVEANNAYKETYGNGSGDKRFENLDESEKKHVFNDRVSELRKKHDLYLKEKEKTKKLEEKSRRENFKKVLLDKVQEGSITALSLWRDSKLDLEKEVSYIALADQPSSTPRAIFDDVVDVLQKAYRTDRKYLRDLLDSHPDFKMKHTTTFDEMIHALTEQEAKNIPEESSRKLPAMLNPANTPDTANTSTAESSSTPTSTNSSSSSKHVRMFFDEMLSREVAAHEEAVRRHRKLVDRYLDLLEDQFYRSDHVDTTWEEAEEKLRKRSAFIDLRDNEKDRRKYFDKHMASLARRMGHKTKVSKSEEANTDGAGDYNSEMKGDQSNEGDGLMSKKKNDLEDGEEDGRGASESEKRKDKKKKKKKHSRSHSPSSDSSSDSDDGDDDQKEKKSSKKKSSKKHKKSKKD